MRRNMEIVVIVWLHSLCQMNISRIPNEGSQMQIHSWNLFFLCSPDFEKASVNHQDFYACTIAPTQFIQSLKLCLKCNVFRLENRFMNHII